MIEGGDATTDVISKTELAGEDVARLAEEVVKSIAPEINTVNDQVEDVVDPGPEVKFKLVYNKQTYEIIMGEKQTVRALKDHIETLTQLPRSMQKLMYKGLLKDEGKTLAEIKVTKNCKMMLVGTTMTDLVAVTTKPTTSEIAQVAGPAVVTKEKLCKQKVHQKVLDKGKPDFAMEGKSGVKLPLPPTPLGGMLNKQGDKVRLTFKLEEDSLWIGTKARTDKVSMGSIKSVVSEAIEDSPEYHIMGIQLGPTEMSRYWLYWVPAQYVDAVKDTVMGKWQTFF